MNINRRNTIGGLAGLSVLAGTGCAPADLSKSEKQMYGLIGKMTAQEGKAAELADILLQGLRDMPGNLSYIVARDPAAADTLWITEVWTGQEAHQASLSLPSVQAAIAKGRPLIASMERIAETKPLGGKGI